MTDEYIRKQDAKEKIRNNLNYLYAYGVDRAPELIDELEPADVAPMVHSQWIKTADGAECEKCGREAVYQIVDDHWEYEPWCPHCGAKMDGGDEHE